MIAEQHLIPVGESCRPGKALKADSITVHWIGPYPHQTPKIVRDWWLQSTYDVAAHFIIKDTVCWQTIPTDEVAWHCGNMKGNNSSIGIEVIPDNVRGVFSHASIETLKDLIDEIGIYKILRHYDWSKKDCPRYYVEQPDKWEHLLHFLNSH